MLEIPTNPTGEFDTLPYLIDRHPGRFTYIVDSTFAPPPLADPLRFGADYVIHSATKFFGGHSDLLAGLVVTKDESDAIALRNERTTLGNVMGSLETYLLLRSLRTLELRVLKQVETAAVFSQRIASISRESTANGALVKRFIKRIYHPAVDDIPQKLRALASSYFPQGFSPVFSIAVEPPSAARKLPTLLKVFTNATSLGSVESLIEWRYKYTAANLSDAEIDARDGEYALRCIVRLSIGIERPEVLVEDILAGLRRLDAKSRL